MYICTQDDSLIPFEEALSSGGVENGESVRHSFAPGPENVTSFPEYQEPKSELAPWIQRAVEQGKYSEDEVDRLRLQKKSVVDTANEAVDRFEELKETIYSTGFPSDLPPKSKSSPSLDIDTSLSFDERSDSWASTSVTQHPDRPKSNLYPYCRFRSCQMCRPTYRDRTWQSFEDVLARDATEVLAKEEKDPYDSRRVVRMSVTRNIGLKKSQTAPATPRGRPRYRSFDVYSAHETPRAGSKPQRLGKEVAQLEDSGDVADEGRSDRIDNMRKMLRQTIQHVLNSRGDKSSPKKKTTPSKRTLGEEVDDASSWESLMPQAAAATEEGELLEDGEEINEDDVVMDERDENKEDKGEDEAVKEESVDLGNLDIITSV